MTSQQPYERVVVHPLVLLSVVDHFNRMKKVGNTKRVVGLLLGSVRNKILDVSNSFAGTYRKSFGQIELLIVNLKKKNGFIEIKLAIYLLNKIIEIRNVN
jgi:hypothetical protein